MGKDGGGGGSYSDTPPGVRSSSVDKAVYDLHIETLKIIEKEMERLHILIQRGDDDVTVSQEQLGSLHAELIRLSEVLSEKECE